MISVTLKKGASFLKLGYAQELEIKRLPRELYGRFFGPGSHSGDLLGITPALFHL
ncbi:MAG: hypothetical protein II835_03655 [Fibrobacter sp.]|nr:hypothetical protein [Fibrobacter sp.]